MTDTLPELLLPELQPTLRWVRAVFGGLVVADSKRAFLHRGPRGRLTYYFPREDVKTELLQEADGGATPAPAPVPADARRGEERRFTVVAGNRRAERAAWSHPAPVAPELAALAGHVAFEWDAMDAWFEEEERVHVHPRDPFVRVDALPSSRHVRVLRDGEVVAESHRPVLLFETGVPTRFYLPELDVAIDHLVPSDTRTRCPYKGEARYFHLQAGGRLHQDIVWYYPYPTAACAAIAGLLCFYQERTQVEVDGERQEVRRR